MSSKEYNQWYDEKKRQFYKDFPLLEISKNRKNYLKKYMKEYCKKYHKQIGTQFILDLFKSTEPCKDCDKIYPPECMQFDHIEEKEHDIGHGRNCKIQDLMKEIDKCELVCANCHCIRTRRRQLEQ